MVALCITSVKVVVISSLLHVLSPSSGTQRHDAMTLRFAPFFPSLPLPPPRVNSGTQWSDSIPPTTTKASNPKMLSCHRSSDPHITDVGLLYDYKNDTDHLWKKNGPLPFCSSISAPSASSCEVCVEQGVKAVCGHLMQAVELVMEAAGRQIEIIKNECPRLFGDATVQSATESPGINPDTRERWPVVIPIVIPILLLILLMVYFILKRNRSTSEPKIKGEKNGDTFYLNIPAADIVEPEAEVQSGKKEAAAHLNVSVADEQEPKAVN